MGKDKDRNKRAVRDQAGVGPDPSEARHLTPMKELKKHRFADGEPDIRGWSVFTSSGRDLGKVEDLLVDTARGEVVMLDVDLRDSDRHTLAPLRAAWVDRDAKRVVLDGAQFDANEEVPSLRRESVSDEEARTFGDRYARTYGDRGFDDREYRVGSGDKEYRFGSRQDETDNASERFRIERREARERDDIAREPVEREESSDVRYQRRDEEEQVIRSRPVVVEETIVRRRVIDESDVSREDEPARGTRSASDDDPREERR